MKKILIILLIAVMILFMWAIYEKLCDIEIVALDTNTMANDINTYCLDE